MRTLSSTLLAEHQKPSRLPSCRVELQNYGHPAAPANVWWDLFSWTQMYSDATAAYYHGVAVAGDGSLNRVRRGSDGKIYRQRVASPGPASTFTSWTDTGAPQNHSSSKDVCITALGAEVLIFWKDKDPDFTYAWIYYIRSLDYGATWGAITYVNTTYTTDEYRIAACHKSNGDVLVALAHGTTLDIARRGGGTWGVGTAYGSAVTVNALSVYHDGDYNMVLEVPSGSSTVLQRFVYGDGYRQAAGTWATPNDLNFSATRVKQTELVNNYVSRFSQEEQPQALQQYLEITANITKAGLDPKMATDAARWLSPLAIGLTVDQKQWQQYTTVLNALAAANSGLTAPFLCRPSGQPVILSVMSFTDRWFYRLKPGTDFYDGRWEKAYSLKTAVFSYGSALASDGAYLWLSRAYDLYRSPMPCVWTTPAAGSGAGTAADLAGVAAVQFQQNDGKKGTISVELDNSSGIYNDVATAGIDRGKRLNIFLGYRTGSDEDSAAARYFIDKFHYSSDKARATLSLEGIDGWELLNRFAFPNDVEWNLMSETLSVYAILSLLVQAIGGTLSYKSRSSLIATLYPHLDIPAGTSSLSLVKRLLSLVPDLMSFFGNDAVIIYPQIYDNLNARYQFPQ